MRIFGEYDKHRHIHIMCDITIFTFLHTTRFPFELELTIPETNHFQC